jgi:predicted metal-dependent peptidase
MQAVEIAKGRGDLPGGMARFVGELLNPTVPWWELVRQWLREQASDDWSWSKPNKYYDESGFILPSLDSERMGPIVFATDTSGSIDQVMLQHFQTEKQNCLDDLKPASLLDICCDSKIQQVAEYRVGDTINCRAPGGGGTSFKPVFQHVENSGVAPKCLVYLTDLDGDFPSQAPDYPVLWIAYGGADKAPFGDVVQAS